MEKRRAEVALAARRVVAHALLALHLVVFVVGGAFVARAPAQAPLQRAVVTAVAGGVDGAAVAAPSEGRLERTTRPRGEGGGAGAPHLDHFVTSSTFAIARASLSGSLEVAAATSAHRPLPSVVHGPRGPPHAC